MWLKASRLQMQYPKKKVKEKQDLGEESAANHVRSKLHQ